MSHLTEAGSTQVEPETDSGGHRQLTTYGEFADILVSLPTLVLNTRRQRRISQRDAAAQAGVSPSTLCRLETGVGDISLEGAIAVLHWMDRLPRAGEVS